MSSDIRRNDPCPCGSGRKYKKCCLVRQQDESRREAAARSARERRDEVVGHALGWLGRHHHDALFAAFAEFESAAVDDGRPLSESDDEYLKMQALEWTLAEGVTGDRGPRSDGFATSCSRPRSCWKPITDSGSSAPPRSR